MNSPLHVHASALDALVVAAYFLIIMAVARQLARRYSESAFGKGLAAIVG